MRQDITISDGTIVHTLDAFPFDSSPNLVTTEQGYRRGDRAVDAWTMQRTFAQFFSDGVFGTPADAFQIAKASSGLAVTIQPGMAVINGGMGGIKESDGAMTLTLDTGAVAGNVCYGIMLRYDNNSSVRSLGIRAVKGTAGASPQPPEPDQTSEGVMEYRLGYVEVPNGATDLTSATVTNEKGLSVCPYAAPFEEIDLEAVVLDAKAAAQEAYESFIEYLDDNMDFIKNAIDGTTAGNLQNQIDQVKEQLENFDLSESVDNDTIFYEAPPLSQDKKLIAKPKVDGATVHVNDEHVLSASPNEDGTFGNYQILYTKNMVKAMMDGNVGYEIEQWSGSPYGSSDAYYVSKDPAQVFTLPDGAIAAVFVDFKKNGSANFWPSCTIVGTDGVSSTSQASAAVNLMPGYSYGAFVARPMNDSFPVKCAIIVGRGPQSDSGTQCAFAGALVTIDEDHTVAFQPIAHKLITLPSVTTNNDSEFYTAEGAVLDDGSVVIVAGKAGSTTTSTETNRSCIVAAKMTPEGIMSNGSAVANTGYSSNSSGYEVTLRYQSGQNINGNIGYENRWILVDKDTLAITNNNQNGSFPSNYKCHADCTLTMINTTGQTRKELTYDHAVNPSTSSESYPIKFLYSGNSDASNAENLALVVATEDGSDEVFLNVTGKTNHFVRTQNGFAIAEDNYTVNAASNLTMANMTHSPLSLRVVGEMLVACGSTAGDWSNKGKAYRAIVRKAE